MLVLELLAPDDYEIPRKYCIGRITRSLWVSPRHKTRHKNACVLLRSSDNENRRDQLTNFCRLTNISWILQPVQSGQGPCKQGRDQNPCSPAQLWLLTVSLSCYKQLIFYSKDQIRTKSPNDLVSSWTGSWRLLGCSARALAWLAGGTQAGVCSEHP